MSQEVFDFLVQNACFRADVVAMETHGTDATKTRMIVRAALEMLIGNGMIVVTPQEEWPVWVEIDPPYKVTP